MSQPSSTRTRVSELIGTDVVSATGERLGRVQDLTVSVHSRQVEYVAFSVDSPDDEKQRRVQVPFSQFRLTCRGLMLNVSAQTLRRFSRFYPPS